MHANFCRLDRRQCEQTHSLESGTNNEIDCHFQCLPNYLVAARRMDTSTCVAGPGPAAAIACMPVATFTPALKRDDHLRSTDICTRTQDIAMIIRSNWQGF